MRLGGPILDKFEDPATWVTAVKALGYRAAFCPVSPTADDATCKAYADAAVKADIVIAEVGAWSNPISPDPEQRLKAMQRCVPSLELAERIGARCCVNIAGSRDAARWDGPHADNLSQETFDMIVASVREIIDAVKPTRTYYTLETMPWIFPDSPESYLRLVKAIDRKAFAVHLDPVNLVNCPARAYDSAGLLRECFTLLGPYIQSCHAKDISLATKLTLHLDECRPGTGLLDYTVFVGELKKLDADLPVMLEHLPGAEEYRLAAEYVRGVARD